MQDLTKAINMKSELIHISGFILGLLLNNRTEHSNITRVEYFDYQLLGLITSYCELKSLTYA